MAKIGVNLKINVSMIEKARLFPGKKGKYLDATVFLDLSQLDQYGNSGMITQDVSKEEKDNNVRGAILGNGIVFWVEDGQAPQAHAPQQAPQQQYQQPQQQPIQQPPANQQQGVYQQQPAQLPPTYIDPNEDIPF